MRKILVVLIGIIITASSCTKEALDDLGKDFLSKSADSVHVDEVIHPNTGGFGFLFSGDTTGLNEVSETKDLRLAIALKYNYGNYDTLEHVYEFNMNYAVNENANYLYPSFRLGPFGGALDTFEDDTLNITIIPGMALDTDEETFWIGKESLEVDITFDFFRITTGVPTLELSSIQDSVVYEVIVPKLGEFPEIDITYY